MHNCLVYSRDSSNVMSLSVCRNINGQPTPSSCKIIQLDRSVVEVVGEMKNVLIQLFVDERVCQFIDIMVVDVLDAYGLILSREWYAKMEGYLQLTGHTCGFPIRTVRIRSR